MKYNYFHKEFRLWIFRLSIFWLHDKWTIRVEVSHGWGD
jgi:hypothetical protein